MLRSLLVGISLVCVLMLSSVLASPQDEYLQIYLMIQEAEKLESTNQQAGAKSKYEASMKKLEGLQQGSPQWEPVIVRYRINYCKDKLDKLKDVITEQPVVTSGTDAAPSDTAPSTSAQGNPSTISAPTPAATAPSSNAVVNSTPAATPTPVAYTQPTDGKDETTVLRARVKELETELTETKKQLAAAVADASELRARQQILEKQIAALKQGPTDARLNDLLEENRKLKEQMNAARQQVANATPQELAALQAKLDKTQNELTAALNQNVVLQKASDEVRKQLEDAQNKLTSNQSQANQAEPLAKENKMLRDIVERAMKNEARRDAAKRLALDEIASLKIEAASLKTQIDLLSSPVLDLSQDEKSMLKISNPDLVIDASTNNISASLGNSGTNAPASASRGGDYSSKPRVPQEFRDAAEKASKLFAERKFDEAAAQYQLILNAYPDSLYALSNLGVIRFQQQNYPEAEKHLKEAVRLSPQDAFSHSILGIVLYQEGKYDDAIQILTRAIALDPSDPKTHNYLGISASQKGWQEAAEQECRKAIELDERYGDAHFNLAVIYATQKPPAKELARRHYNRAMELGVPRDEQLEQLMK